MEPSPEPKPTASQTPRGRWRLRHFVVLLLLLIAPGFALHRLSAHIHYQWLLAYAVAVSAATYALYGADKDSAEDPASSWRASEKLLHVFEMAGGWPGAFLAQRRFRHKCSKVSYQLVFWFIVAIHLTLATDYVLHWRLLHSVWIHLFPPAPVPGAP